MAEEKEVVIAIDDDELTLKTIESLLGIAGDYEILMFNRAIKGLAEVKREVRQFKNPPVVLLDLNMPLVDGYAVFQNLRNTAETGKVPIIIVSGHELDTDRIQGIRQPDDFIPKPIQFQKLVNAVKRAFARSKADTKGVVTANTEYVKIIEDVIRKSRRPT